MDMGIRLFLKADCNGWQFLRRSRGSGLMAPGWQSGNQLRAQPCHVSAMRGTQDSSRAVLIFTQWQDCCFSSEKVIDGGAAEIK
jgi:hypothetical protein